MSKDRELYRMNSHEHHRGPFKGRSADGKIRYYGGVYPVTIVDLPKMDDHLTLNLFSYFEFSKEGDPDTVKIRKGHHEKVLFAFGDAVINNGLHRFKLISPDGPIGILETEDKSAIAPFLASLFHPNEDHIKRAGNTRVDDSVLDYLSKERGLPIILRNRTKIVEVA